MPVWIDRAGRLSAGTQGNVALPQSVAEDADEQQGTADADNAEQFFQAGEHGLLGHDGIKVADGDVGHPVAHTVYLAADEADVVLLQVLHPAAQDGRSQRSGNAGTYETQHTKSLEKVLEGHALGNVDGERDVEDAVSDTFQEIGQVQAFDVQVGMDEEVHVVLVDDDEQKAHRDEQFVAFVQYGLAVEYNGSAGQYADEYPPVQRYGVQRVVVENGTHKLVLQHRRGSEKQAEHEKQEEDDREVAVFEHLRLNVGAAQGTHPVDVDQQRYDGNDDTGAYLHTVQPVVIFAVDADENNGEKHHAP